MVSLGKEAHWLAKKPNKTAFKPRVKVKNCFMTFRDRLYPVKELKLFSVPRRITQF